MLAALKTLGVLGAIGVVSVGLYIGMSGAGAPVNGDRSGSQGPDSTAAAGATPDNVGDGDLVADVRLLPTTDISANLVVPVDINACDYADVGAFSTAVGVELEIGDSDVRTSCWLYTTNKEDEHAGNPRATVRIGPRGHLYDTSYDICSISQEFGWGRVLSYDDSCYSQVNNGHPRPNPYPDEPPTFDAWAEVDGYQVLVTTYSLSASVGGAASVGNALSGVLPSPSLCEVWDTESLTAYLGAQMEQVYGVLDEGRSGVHAGCVWRTAADERPIWIGLVTPSTYLFTETTSVPGIPTARMRPDSRHPTVVGTAPELELTLTGPVYDWPEEQMWLGLVQNLAARL